MKFFRFVLGGLIAALGWQTGWAETPKLSPEQIEFFQKKIQPIHSRGETNVSRQVFFSSRDLDNNVASSWEKALHGWKETGNAVFAPWIELAGLPEENFQAFAENSWRMRCEEATGPALINAKGGRTDEKLNRAAVRRWTAPHDGVVSVEGDRSIEWRKLFVGAGRDVDRAERKRDGRHRSRMECRGGFLRTGRTFAQGFDAVGTLRPDAAAHERARLPELIQL